MMAGPQEHNWQLGEAGRGWTPKGQPLGGGFSHAAHLQYSHAKTQRPPMAPSAFDALLETLTFTNG